MRFSVLSLLVLAVASSAQARQTASKVEMPTLKIRTDGNWLNSERCSQ